MSRDSNSRFPNMALAIDEPTVVDTVLYYALFLGAVFQLICILSVIVLPKSIEEQVIRQNKCVWSSSFKIVIFLTQRRFLKLFLKLGNIVNFHMTS